MELNCSAEISREDSRGGDERVGVGVAEAEAKNEEIRDAEISTKVIFALNTNGTFVDTMISPFTHSIWRPLSIFVY